MKMSSKTGGRHRQQWRGGCSAGDGMCQIGEFVVDKDCDGIEVAGCRGRGPPKPIVTTSNVAKELEGAARVLQVDPVILCFFSPVATYSWVSLETCGQYTNRSRLS